MRFLSLPSTTSNFFCLQSSRFILLSSFRQDVCLYNLIRTTIMLAIECFLSLRLNNECSYSDQCFFGTTQHFCLSSEPCATRRRRICHRIFSFPVPENDPDEGGCSAPGLPSPRFYVWPSNRARTHLKFKRLQI
jgi:hypothetical protein